uniref:N1221 domain-containing protein n=1 Tax=Schistosoma curassoni TaxID=6186 RepID=A0A183JZF2_9TREM
MDCPIEDIDKKDPVVEQNTDVNFVYNDTDEYSVEIAELYSYSEEPEFHLNRECFEKDFHKFVCTTTVTSCVSSVNIPYPVWLVETHPNSVS